MKVVVSVILFLATLMVFGAFGDEIGADVPLGDVIISKVIHPYALQNLKVDVWLKGDGGEDTGLMQLFDITLGSTTRVWMVLNAAGSMNDSYTGTLVKFQTWGASEVVAGPQSSCADVTEKQRDCKIAWSFDPQVHYVVRMVRSKDDKLTVSIHDEDNDHQVLIGVAQLPPQKESPFLYTYMMVKSYASKSITCDDFTDKYHFAFHVHMNEYEEEDEEEDEDNLLADGEEEGDDEDDSEDENEKGDAVATNEKAVKANAKPKGIVDEIELSISHEMDECPAESRAYCDKRSGVCSHILG